MLSTLPVPQPNSLCRGAYLYTMSQYSLGHHTLCFAADEQIHQLLVALLVTPEQPVRIPLSGCKSPPHSGKSASSKGHIFLANCYYFSSFHDNHTEIQSKVQITVLINPV